MVPEVWSGYPVQVFFSRTTSCIFRSPLMKLSLKQGIYEMLLIKQQKQLDLTKKVLLCECKGHTDRRVASACYAALSSGLGVWHPRSQGYPIPGWGGTLARSWWWGGYPIPGLGVHPIPGWGTPVRSWWWGVPHPSRGYPSQVLMVGMGVPHPTSRGYPIPGRGVPQPGLDGGIPSQVLGGYPIPGWGYPMYPHHQDLDGVPPTIKTWLGYSPPPHHPGLTGVPTTPDLRWGTPPPTIQTWMGYPTPSPRNVNRQTPVKTVPSLVLRTRAVNTNKWVRTKMGCNEVNKDSRVTSVYKHKHMS